MNRYKRKTEKKASNDHKSLIFLLTLYVPACVISFVQPLDTCVACSTLCSLLTRVLFDVQPYRASVLVQPFITCVAGRAPQWSLLVFLCTMYSLLICGFSDVQLVWTPTCVFDMQLYEAFGVSFVHYC